MLAVFLGGGLGSILRFVISKLLNSDVAPLGTLFVNLAGCFFLGLFTIVFLNTGLIRDLLIVGFCGGLTTFSTFTKETTQLLSDKNNRIKGFIYLLGSIILGIFSIYFGLKVANFFS